MHAHSPYPTMPRALSPQGQAYLGWLQDRGLYWYSAQPPAPLLLFLCEGISLEENQALLLQRMGLAVGLPPSRFQSLCMGAYEAKHLATLVQRIRPASILVLGTGPSFLSSAPEIGALPPWRVTWSLYELLTQPLLKKDTWAALLALKEIWSTPLTKE